MGNVLSFVEKIGRKVTAFEECLQRFNRNLAVASALADAVAEQNALVDQVLNRLGRAAEQPGNLVDAVGPPRRQPAVALEGQGRDTPAREFIGGSFGFERFQERRQLAVAGQAGQLQPVLTGEGDHHVMPHAQGLRAGNLDRGQQALLDPKPDRAVMRQLEDALHVVHVVKRFGPDLHVRRSLRALVFMHDGVSFLERGKKEARGAHAERRRAGASSLSGR
jgi:hypothetical protein